MRIAYLTQSYPPMVSGVAIVAQRLAEGMAARNHTVLVIAASDRGEPYMAFKNNFLLLRLRSVVNSFRVRQRLLVYPRHAIMKALRDFEPDIIHTHDMLQIGRLGSVYGRSMKVPVVSTLHQVPWFVLPYLPNIPGLRSGAEAALWQYARWFVRQYAAITAPTQMISNLISEMTEVLPCTISNGVDLKTFRPSTLSSKMKPVLRERFGIPPSVPIILHVGRLDVDKHVERVILASAQAMMNNPNAHLLIVGDGYEKPSLIRLCASFGITERCHFPGFISVQDGLPDIYRIATLFITASEIETQGIVLLEAAASGLPIVATRATCIPEIVQDGVNGYLAKPGNVNKLSEAVIDLLENPRKAKAMGVVGRRLIEQHDLQNTMDAHEELYQRLTSFIK